MIDVADSNKYYYYHFDGLGSVVALSDENADIVEKYTYDVFGECTVHGPGPDGNWGTGDDITDCNSLYDNPYLFTARRLDPETGLYYYRARMYNPQIGRFMQTDPVGYTAGLNLYTYCGNNPLNWTDPYGLDKDDPWWEDWYDFLYNLGYNWDYWNAITISLSGAGFRPDTAGFGCGIELVYIFGKGWVIYLQLGPGQGVPGGGGALEIGPIFNLDQPSDYTGLFVEAQGGLPVGNPVVGVSLSGFYDPEPGILHPGGGPWGAKGGLYVGTPGGGVIAESYGILYDFTQ